jgi:hypothetical protein
MVNKVKQFLREDGVLILFLASFVGIALFAAYLEVTYILETERKIERIKAEINITNQAKSALCREHRLAGHLPHQCWDNDVVVPR